MKGAYRTARKSLGQNFLTRAGTAREIVSFADPGKNDTVVEIGAGTGMLTEALAERAGRVVSFEIDRSLVEPLRHRFADRPDVEIVEGDFLSTGPAVLGGLDSFKVVSNPPYYISSPIIFLLLACRNLSLAVLTLQKELARRLVAAPGGREYGAMTLTVALDMEAEIVKTLGRGAFSPAPEVDSAVVLLRRRAGLFSPGEKEAARRIVRGVFTRRRKMILNALAASLEIPTDQARLILERAGVNPGSRPAELTLSDYLAVARRVLERAPSGRTDGEHP